MSFAFDEQELPGGIRHVTLSGALDTTTSKERGDEIVAMLCQKGGKVLLDLSALEYISSASMRVFLRCAQQLQNDGGELHIASPQPRVMSVLTISGYVEAFPVYQTLDEARAFLKS